MADFTEYGRIYPTAVDATDYTFNESINVPVADGSVTSTIPTMDVSTVKGGIFYATKQYELKSPFGKFKGTVNTTDDSNQLNLFNRSGEGMSILSTAYRFNRIRSVPPFQGTLTAYFDLLAQLVGFEGRRIIKWNNNDTICELGYFGNVFENLAALITALNMDINFFYDIVIIAPSRRIELDNTIFKQLPDIQYQDGVDSRWIKTNYYKTEWHDRFVCYPFNLQQEEDNPGGIWLPPLDIDAQNILSVENIGMGEGAYVEQDIELSSSLLEVYQPECLLPPAVMLLKEDYSYPAVLYAYVGQWVVIGMVIDYTAQPSDLTDPNKSFINANQGEFVLVDSNHTFYMCTVGAEGTGDDFVPAQWVQWASFNGIVFNNQDAIDAWIEQNDIVNDAGFYNGFYTVIGANGFPIMPELWTSSGGKLEVELNPDTKSVKVKLWGADIPLNMPVFTIPPTSTTGYPEGQIIGYDKSARPTKHTLWFVLENGAWVYDESIQSFPYAPYKIAITSGNTDYNGLYLTGKGVKFVKENISLESGRWDDPNNATERDSLTAEIDNQFIHSAQKALEVSQDYDAFKNGSSFTFSVDCTLPKEYDFIGAKRGSWDDIIDYMLYYGYDMGLADSRDLVDAWWAQHLDNTNFTRSDIDEAIMKDTEHHISANLFGRVSGCRIMVPNRGMFRITDASITPTNLNISGYQDTRFGDLDNLVMKFNKNLTLGDLDDLFAEVQKIERLGDWTLGLRNQEPARLTV